MILSVQSKILMTVLSVVLMFALFILFYYPARQESILLENYNSEIEHYANSVALGVKIALTEENFEGVEMSLNYVRDDNRLQFVSIIQNDSIWNENSSGFEIKKEVFMTFPDSITVDPYLASTEDFIIKTSPFSTPAMNGEVMLSFSTNEIAVGRRQIRIASAIASLTVFVIGLLIGYWLARKISVPVLELRDAANRVGEGDFTQSVINTSKDEIGELSIAFNKMVRDLNSAQIEISKRTEELTEEKKKSDELLLNILPIETAMELKSTGTSKAKYHESVTVLFTDFKDFTSISKTMSATQLVSELHNCFSRFDHIIRKYNIEKIKTIGDAYMCVAGLDTENEDHHFDVIKAAIEINECMKEYRREKEERGEIGFEIRIGIHSGPVVAGIVGVDKFAYDIWGSTVNLASRMEKNSEPNKINISHSLYQVVKTKYECTCRGKIVVKGLNEMEMYFVNGPKESFS
ncbi:adenylate/guanylate cyclase domain-containing protein [Maribacter arcticus]|uniref:Adenylate cyclase, class 3 n=1 Tax=Maribacter arcticus TaxID=561365 RepID=A0A1T5D6X3_9FLAO|nr:adenylate/guanylate cyclase domain-containing protein [Maribacter arcticus]SKB67273.1 Adenylate cyclase, class 3 [Maribacter arcticus]